MALTHTYEIRSTVQDSSGNSKPWPSVVHTITTTGSNEQGGSMNTSTSAAQIPIGSVAVGGATLLRNKSATTAETIHIRDGAAGSNFLTIPAGEEMLVFFSSGIDPYAVSATGTPILEFEAIDA